MGMASHIFFALSNPIPGREDEYNEWYTNVHVRDVSALPGFVSGQRFKLHANKTGEMPGQYLAIYELETDDPEAAYEGINTALMSGKMFVSSAIHADSLTAAIFTPIMEKYVPKR
jgi:hypothetical protein